MSVPADSLQVVCAVIMNDAQHFLACQRCAETSLAGKWEFPGGKIEAGESKETAVKREILEELGVEIHLSRPLETVEHQYADFHISLHPFLCKIEAGKEPQASEHASLRWIDPATEIDLDWSDADRAIISQIQQMAEKRAI